MNAASSKGKDVIYIDVDEEITGIIDKVRGSHERIVALVLPKRAAVLQSIVNMKLLKRSSDSAKKHIVLITSESGLLPLAGSVGVHVAKSLQSKPEVPDAPAHVDDRDDTAVEELADEQAAASPTSSSPSPAIDRTKTIGELTGDEEESIDLDNEEESTEDAGAAGKKGGKSKGKKFKIPNFNKFRLLLLIGVPAAIALIVFGVVAFTVMPKAEIVIKTNSTAVNSSQDITLKTGDDVTLDVKEAIIPATAEQNKKTITQQVAATGQKNNGEKAAGQVTLSLTDCSKDQVTVPAGTGLSADGKTFIIGTSATLESVKVGNQCKNSSFPNFSTKTVAVTAQSAGSQYNIGASTFSVAGYSNVTGQSSAAMSGGTDDIIKVVSQADIDSAKEKIGSQDTKAVKEELKGALQTKGLFAIENAFTATAPETKLSANAGDEAETVTVTQDVTYTMMGVKEDDLEKIIAENVSEKIDTDKQTILDYGLGEADFTLQNQQGQEMLVGIHATVVAGSDLDVKEIKKQVAGKKANDAKELIKENPGVTDVTVTYSPFWVSSIPNKQDKITVTVEKPKVTSDAESDE